MTHPYARPDPEEQWPEEGPNPVEIRYGPGRLSHTLWATVLGSVVTVLLVLGQREPDFVYALLAATWLAGLVVAVVSRRRAARDRPRLLTVTDHGIRHWGADGTRGEGFRWGQIASIELESPPLIGPVLCVHLTEEARAERARGEFGSGRPPFVSGDYVIGLDAVEGSPAAVMDVIDRVQERLQLREVRDAHRQLREGDG